MSDTRRMIPAPLGAPPPPPPPELESSGLTPRQEIRARALDAAARLIGPMLAADAADGHLLGDLAPDGMDVWVRAASVATAWIETGDSPAPQGDPCPECGLGYRIGDDGCRHGQATGGAS